jgi:hypothetical protein
VPPQRRGLDAECLLLVGAQRDAVGSHRCRHGERRKAKRKQETARVRTEAGR